MFHDAYRFDIIHLEFLYCSAFIQIIQIQNIIGIAYIPIQFSDNPVAAIQRLDSLHLSTIYERAYQMPITGFPRIFQTSCARQTTFSITKSTNYFIFQLLHAQLLRNLLNSFRSRDIRRVLFPARINLFLNTKNYKLRKDSVRTTQKTNPSLFYEITNKCSYMQSILFHCQVHSTCFGCFLHPSSGVQFLTVSTATGTNHTVRYKDNVIR